MVKQCDIITGRHLYRRICIARYSKVLIQNAVMDPFIIKILPDHCFRPGNVRASVRNAKLPVRIRLSGYRFDHFAQIPFRCRKHRHHNTYDWRILPFFVSLSLLFLLCQHITFAPVGIVHLCLLEPFRQPHQKFLQAVLFQIGKSFFQRISV